MALPERRIHYSFIPDDFEERKRFFGDAVVFVKSGSAAIDLEPLEEGDYRLPKLYPDLNQLHLPRGSVAVLTVKRADIVDEILLRHYKSRGGISNNRKRPIPDILCFYFGGKIVEVEGTDNQIHYEVKQGVVHAVNRFSKPFTLFGVSFDCHFI